MRVLMIQTPSVEGISQEKVYPIGIVTLASVLKGYGHVVEILDMNLAQDPFAALKEKLLTFQPGVVGLSLRNIDPLANKTSSLIPPFVVTVRLIAAVWPHARLIVGGTGFSLFPKRLLQELPEIDYGIVGEAETSFPALLSSMDSLDVLRKHLVEADILRAARLTARTDVLSVYHFMVNVPGESKRTIEKGISLLDRLYELHSPKKDLGTVVLNNIRILPGTPIEQIAKEQGVIDEQTDLLYPVYYNPKPFETLRYRLETLHLDQNVFMWQEIRK
ncbi:B12 binding domain protein [Peptococcaceae bacterium CEB3]|nr:B12 binding domain protein [Peptococcaceae bacterium CEB3]